ncbi:bifunctional 3-phenylpropionate/cinnamic acid dioxygenase ferredoxin subunit [Alicyclobacillus contaminans]|uniref:non-heme iron oxygenase ferredoxin subunit n=1 Tax=Alicyclobacillus contaminans TaxID=392016 RepID=UPI00042875A5|nr:non-heme iron oxygenase ferredoxin subunit [Alicyclobacillus contaminans]GMA49554.1 bifunctional 3-phenylpropionate/cinnamic acid dioxygenase ferredoxin subunit [Alicyclobacillus contaminans]
MTWMKVAKATDIAVGSMVRVDIEDNPVAVYHAEDGFYATSDTCTHAAQSLSEGRLDGCIISCPKHGGKFDIRTGAAVAFPCVYPVETYDVEVRDGEVWVDV